MKKILIISFLLFIAMGAKPIAVIEGPSTRQVGQGILLDARKSVSDRPLRWRLLNKDTPFLTFDQNDQKSVFAYIPDAETGVYRFALIAIGTSDNDIDADVFVYEVTVGPGPGPGPISNELIHVTMIYDVERPDASRALIRTDPEIRALAAQMNVAFRTYEDDSPSLKLLPYLKGIPPPVLVFQRNDGTIFNVVPCPPTVESTIALIKALR